MRQTNAQLLAEQKPLGVIDALTAGFEVVRKRPWTIAIPVLVDLVIWLLPRLSLADLFRPAVDQLFPTTGIPADLVESAQEMHDAASQFVSSLNVFGLAAAAVNSTARLPSLLAFNSGDIHSPINALAYTIQLQSALYAIYLFIPLFLLGLFGAAVYIELIAQGVRPLTNQDPLAWLVRAVLLWFRLSAFALLLALALFATAIVLMFTQVFAPLGGDGGSFIAALVAVGWFWLTLYLFFVIAALAVDQVGLVTAIRRSVLLFRLQFWSALGLIVLSIFLERGLALIWNGLATAEMGALFTLLAIAANAAIGTGLLAAAMIFYQDRMNFTERLLARLKATPRRSGPPTRKP